MYKYVIVADDLTGANATCSLLKKIGLRASNIFHLDKSKKTEYETEVIAYSTASRGLEKKEAYEKVNSGMKFLKNENVLVYNKRIDSTLRGNLGSEIQAMLDNLEENRIAIIVPAYPDSKRIVINKTMLVNDLLLEDSDAGRDPKNPIKTSNVEEIIKNQLNIQSKYFTLSEISTDENILIEKIKEAAKKYKALIFDAVSNENIIKIAKCIIKSELNIITVDPGPFTMYYTKELQKNKNLEKKILMVIGSVTDLSKKQIEYILKEEDIFLVKMKVENFFDEECRNQEIDKVLSMIKKGIDSYNLFLLTTTPIGEDKKIDLFQKAKEKNISVEEISQIISNTLTEAAEKVIKETKKFQGIYSSGGDITIALLEKLKAIGVEIREEVIPLAAYGRIIGGEFKNLKLVTKGGMVGDETTIKKCLHKMINDI